MFKPIQQTKFSDLETGARGNCLRAAVASIFGVDINEVPAFEDMVSGEWQGPLEDFVLSKGYYWDGMWYLGRGNNEELSDEQIQRELKLVPTIDGYVIVNGASPRGIKFGHSVVYKDGEFHHDPHPDGNGLLQIWDAYVFIPRNHDGQTG